MPPDPAARTSDNGSCLANILVSDWLVCSLVWCFVRLFRFCFGASFSVWFIIRLFILDRLINELNDASILLNSSVRQSIHLFAHPSVPKCKLAYTNTYANENAV